MKESNMKALLQRVTSSKVSVDGVTAGEIGCGITVFVCAVGDDTQKDIDWLADKIVNLRIFDDEEGKMNLSVKDVGGELLVISQFTLCGDCRKGRRPSWVKAAPADFAEEMYLKFIEAVKKTGVHTEQGRFQTHMSVDIRNDGPVTLMIDTKE